MMCIYIYILIPLYTGGERISWIHIHTRLIHTSYTIVCDMAPSDTADVTHIYMHVTHIYMHLAIGRQVIRLKHTLQHTATHCNRYGGCCWR